jgi:hyperosmotically inducible periplasmic protein
MKIIKLSVAAVIAISFAFTSCKPKDADIQSEVQKKEAAGITVSVAEGVVTLSGTVADEAAKASAEEAAKGEKGVKSVVNNLMIPAPPPPPAPAPVASAMDAMSSAVKDAVKDHPTVSATVADGVIILTGSIKKDKLPKLMMTLSSLKPRKIDNKLTVN